MAVTSANVSHDEDATTAAVVLIVLYGTGFVKTGNGILSPSGVR
jgi:hypothetical protein